MDIVLTTSTSFSSRSNGLAKRMSCTLMDKVRDTLEDASMPRRYWGEALNQAATLHECTIESAIKNSTLLESLFGSAPNN